MTMDASRKTLLGIDFGTGGCKVTAIDFDGRLIADCSLEYPTYHEQPNWSEQEPADWYATMCRALSALAEKGVDLKAVTALSLDGSTHNAVLLDSAMRPIRRTIMWTDQRSTAECALLREKLGDDIYQTTYQMPSPTWTLPQLMWLRNHDPETLDRTRHILFVKDYLRYLLTGEAATDHIEAQGTLFYDMRKRDWAEDLFELTGLPHSVLPKLMDHVGLAGCITAQAASDTGLAKGTPVICGTSDSAVEDYGAGAVNPGDCIVKLATAGNVNAMTAEAHPHPRTLTYGHVISGMWYTVSATNAAALCERWFRGLCCETEAQEAQRRCISTYQVMDELAGQSPAGANGVFFHPYLQGERSPYWDANLRASFTGVSITSTKGDFMRALLEGVAFSLLDCYGLLRELKLPVDRLILIGGGAKSDLWSRIICNVFNLPVDIPCHGDASFGSALLAGTGAGVFADRREAVKRCLHIRRSLTPNPSEAARYAELFAQYRSIHDALAPIYAVRS